MKAIRNFTITINQNKKSDKAPDRRISAKLGEEWIEIASGWKKQDKNGRDYVSCQMSKSWVDANDNSKTRKGWVIVAEEDLKEAGIELELE